MNPIGIKAKKVWTKSDKYYFGAKRENMGNNGKVENRPRKILIWFLRYPFSEKKVLVSVEKHERDESERYGCWEKLAFTEIKVPFHVVHRGLFLLFGVPFKKEAMWRNWTLEGWTWETDEKYLEKMNFCFPNLDAIGALEIISRAIRLGMEAKWKK